MKYLFSFLIISILLSNIYGLAASAQESQQLPGAPKTLEEAKTIGERILWGFPEVLKGLWQEAITLWKKMIDYISPLFKNILQKISSFLGKEVETRKPEVKEEFEKEKQEMREEIPKVSKSLWQRFKELIK